MHIQASCSFFQLISMNFWDTIETYRNCKRTWGACPMLLCFNMTMTSALLPDLPDGSSAFGYERGVPTSRCGGPASLASVERRVQWSDGDAKSQRTTEGQSQVHDLQLRMASCWGICWRIRCQTGLVTSKVESKGGCSSWHQLLAHSKTGKHRGSNPQSRSFE